MAYDICVGPKIVRSKHMKVTHEDFYVNRSRYTKESFRLYFFIEITVMT